MPRNKRAVQRAGDIDVASNSPAFTVIELLATTVIAAILMLAVLTVVGQLGRDQTRLAHGETQAAPEQIVQLLSKDLARATSITVDPQTGAVILEGYGALEQTTFIPTGRAARVTYSVLSSASGQWLMRKQLSLDEAYAHPWVECVGSAIKRLTVTPEQAADVAGATANAGSGAGSQMAQAGTTKVAYERVRLQIEWADAGRSPFDQAIVLR
jgi:type II secretory pathway component PulJ